MPQIETYVFFDIETTGFPWQERNGTKIIEASFVAVQRKDIERANFGDIPLASKYTFVLNPLRPIHPEVTALTGLSNQSLEHAPLFIDKFNSLNTFLDELPKPAYLLCVDSLIGFRKLLKGTTIGYSDLRPVNTELLTDDEDEDNWPDLNVSREEWEEIDEICLSLSDISCEDVNEGDSSDNEETRSRINARDEVIKNVFRKGGLCSNVPKNDGSKGKESFTLSALYKRLLNKEAVNAHRAEVDCIMLLECVVALKNDFLPWADDACKLLSQVKPLIRY
ncbi:hypothetical protein JYU34_015507 [Plutella xylostella]|uniref:Exonuclease domain-containing protein n=1 Tax=Plutella xylostella TaxID=51655 RepID=A0ABQ7Q794_PLUXY|nr:hypothetical protein JYU34_015507 [Plutella xylostella]